MIPIDLQPLFELDHSIRAAGVPLLSLDKRDPWDKTTWACTFDTDDAGLRAEYQTQAQALIDAFAWPTTDAQALRDYARGASLDAERDAKRAALDALFAAKWTTPFSHDFGSIATADDSGNVGGAAGVQTLQMRDDTDHPDQRNWNVVATNAAICALGGALTTVIPIKVTSNVWVRTTAADLLALLPQVSARQVTILAAYGALKAAIGAAADAAALAAIDIAAPFAAIS